jgi:hypothetical protein
MKDWWKKNGQYLILVILIGLIIIIAVGSYIANFGNREQFQISDKTEIWGAFADYLNFFAGLINTVLLTFITFEIRRLDLKREADKIQRELDRETERKNEERESEIQRNKIEEKRLDQTLEVQKAITLSQIQHEEFKYLVKKVNEIRIFDYSQTVDDILSRTTEFRNVINNFIEDHLYLFKKNIVEAQFDDNLEKLEHTLLYIEDNAFSKEDLNTRIKNDNIEYKLLVDNMKNHSDKSDETYKFYMEQQKNMKADRKELVEKWSKLNKNIRDTQVDFLSQKKVFMDAIRSCITKSLEPK